MSENKIYVYPELPAAGPSLTRFIGRWRRETCDFRAGNPLVTVREEELVVAPNETVVLALYHAFFSRKPNPFASLREADN